MINFDVLESEPLESKVELEQLKKQLTYRNGSKTKFSVGDKVRVRSDLKIGKRYGMEHEPIAKDVVVDEMLKFAGKIVTIESDRYKYTIKEFNYSWTDEMFEDEPVEVAE